MSLVSSAPAFVARNSRSGSYQIEQSLRFDGSSYMTRTPASNGSLSTWTYSTWIKYGDVAGSIVNTLISTKATVTPYGQLLIRADQELGFYQRNSGNTDSSWQKYSSNKLRDPSAWYHFLFVLNTGDSTVNNRQRMWINGVEVTSFSSDYKPGSADNSAINSTQEHMIGAYRSSSIAGYMKGYMAETHFVDGSALDPTSFGEYDDNGVWRPKRYTGSHGTNGFYLKFDPSATNGIGHDHSGNGNNFTPTGFDTTNSTASTYDVMSDTPTDNYCTLNPLAAGANFQDGNLALAGGSSSYSRGTQFLPSSGSFYYEYTVSGGPNFVVGFNGPGTGTSSRLTLDNSPDFGGSKGVTATGEWSSASITAPSTMTSSGDIIGVTYDFDNATVTWTKNGSAYAQATSVPVTTFSPAIWIGANSSATPVATGHSINFGQQPFQYQPTGTSAYSTSNLPAPSIKDGSDYFAPIVGPGDTETAWSETNTAVSVSGGQLTTYDGLANTEHLLGRTDTKYPPIDFIRTLRELELDGYDDWYLGSKYEMEVIYYNLKPTTDNNTTVADSQDNAYSVPQRTALNYTAGTPSQTSVSAFQSGGAQAFDSETSTAQVYYTSSAGNTNVANAKAFRTSGGLDAGYNYNSGQKYSENGITRAIRRAAYTGSEPSIGAAYLGGYYAGLYSLNGDGTATHALIVSDKANGENTGMRALVQQKFSSGLYWIKDRQASDEHKLIDSVRGLTNQLSSNLTTAETTYSDPDNASVAWNWLAGNGTSSNTDGSITSTVSANPTAGFSIVSYTGNGTSGATVGHGLGVKPSLLIVRRRPTASNWTVYHSSVGATKRLILDLNYAPQTSSGWWNNTEPTSTVFTIGNDGGTNSTTNNTYIAYCWSEVPGFSKFGSYTGNGNADGPFVHCGFRPAWILVKRSDTTNDWLISDSSRLGYNTRNELLWANLASAEYQIVHLDILSNGFKVRTTNPGWNASGGTYIFMALAENPFGGSGVSPATAR